jgi:hypothetical protein
MTTAEILLRLDQIVKTGSGWTTRCPAHDDRDPSLSIATGADGRIILHCHAGCTPENVCAAIGITLADLFADEPRHNGHAKQIVATYPYYDSSGRLIFEVVRFNPKDFRQRQPDGKGGWLWKMNGVQKVLFRLPEILAAIKAGRPIFVCEGEKDVLAMVAHGFTATCNPGGAGKWEKSYSETLRGAEVIIVADEDAPGRAHARKVATALNGVAASLKVIECPDVGGRPVKDAADYFAAGGQACDLDQLTQDTPHFAPEPDAPGDDLQRAIADTRPKIRLPGSDRLLSDFARDLGDVLADKDIFLRNGEVVTLADNDLKPITPQSFRSWAEQFFVGYRAKTVGENTFEFNVTMSDNEARGTLAAPQFQEKLRRVRRVNRARLPIIAEGGKLDLLPFGYHAQTQTLTLSDADYDLDVTLDAARQTLDDLLAEFRFADGDRSKAVAVAAMLGVYASQLLPQKSLRPCFIFLANAEGAGKTLLAQICVVPTLGAMPIASKADDDDEIRKALITAIREGQQVLFFDNIKGRLSSEPLEAFLSAPVFGGRKLGVNENVTGDNLATVFCTGNGMTVSPDMRRRSLFVELHLEVERAEDRKFSRVLDLPALLSMRGKILAALWALVRHWDAKARPGPSRGHSAFPTWADVVGGIIEAAGFSCPLSTADVSATADPDSEDMRSLVKEMSAKPAPLTFAEVVTLAQQHGLFESTIGTDASLGRREKSAFGRLLARYDHRLVSECRFRVEGAGHARRYRIQPIHGDMVGHGVSDEKTSLYARELGRKNHADHADHE